MDWWLAKRVASSGRRFGLRVHAHFERAQSAQQQPCLERAEDRAVMAAHLLDARPQHAIRGAASTPATTSEWPFRYFVAECITMSAPSESGLVNSGVAAVESMPSKRAAGMRDLRDGLRCP